YVSSIASARSRLSETLRANARSNRKSTPSLDCRDSTKTESATERAEAGWFDECGERRLDVMKDASIECAQAPAMTGRILAVYTALRVAGRRDIRRQSCDDGSLAALPLGQAHHFRLPHEPHPS